MKKTYLLYILAAFAVAGCYKTYELDWPGGYTKPVINTFIQHDSLLKVTVSHSSAAEEYRVYHRGDATVKLYADGVYQETLQPRQTAHNVITFFSQGKLSRGTRYRVTAEIPGFPLAEGEDVIPPPVPRIEAGFSPIMIGNYVSNYSIKFRVFDDGAERNYYRVRLFYKTTYNGHTYTGTTPVRLEDDGTENWELFGDDGVDEVLLDDALFNGRSPLYHFRTQSLSYADEFYLEVSQLTRDAYQYFRSAQLQRNRRGDDIGEKVTVHSNIRNGLGIVGGMTVQYFTYKP
ncbi:DUF4249 domain-containing protein [Chitinophaga deserti]|uniref:DUF4249 domain-containing protein n=1 Tax=Chitinophaga deserti TaxID=2164099 RepID=UPI0013008431|nr:DUF4249 domain-containing protein [Chitinophaga deserti]